MNLRQESESESQLIVNLFKERQKSVSLKYQMEMTVTNENSKLIIGLSEYFHEIAVKSSIGFNLCVNDNFVILSTDIVKTNKLKGQKYTISMQLPRIGLWFDDTNSLEGIKKEIEKKIRLLATLNRSYIKTGKIQFQRPNVTVSLETKNRYF